MGFSSAAHILVLKGTTSPRGFSNVQRSGSFDRKKMASQVGISEGGGAETQVLVTVYIYQILNCPVDILCYMGYLVYST